MEANPLMTIRVWGWDFRRGVERRSVEVLEDGGEEEAETLETTEDMRAISTRHKLA